VAGALSGVRGNLFIGGNLALLVFSMLATPYPEGDPARARQAAQVWSGLADDIVEWARNGDDAAHAVITNDGGEAVDAFARFWRRYAAPDDPAQGDAARLENMCRRMGEACGKYADLVEKAKQTFVTMAFANFASALFISTFPWSATAAFKIAEFLTRRVQAKILAALLSKTVEYTVGSLIFSVGDVFVMDAVKAVREEGWAGAIRGKGWGSWDANFDEGWKEFAASVAFYGVFDATAKPASMIIKNKDVQYFVSRLVSGTVGYGPTYGLLSGKRGDELIPTVKDTTLRVLLYTTMAHKPAG
jgi:hypothetical protein